MQNEKNNTCAGIGVFVVYQKDYCSTTPLVSGDSVVIFEICISCNSYINKFVSLSKVGVERGLG